MTADYREEARKIVEWYVTRIGGGEPAIPESSLPFLVESIAALAARSQGTDSPTLDFLREVIAEESRNETQADGMDMADCANWHKGRRELVEGILAALLANSCSQGAETCICGHIKSLHWGYDDHDECHGCSGIDEPCSEFRQPLRSPLPPL